MRYFDHLFDRGELHLRVVVDSKDGVLGLGEGLEAVATELDLRSALPGAVRVVLAG